MTPRQVPTKPARIRFGGVQTPTGFLFELTGGSLCLDLANTLDERRSGQPRERLRGYDDLVDWGVQAGAITRGEKARLLACAAAEPAAGKRALQRAVRFREAAFVVFSAIARGRAVPDRAFDELNQTITRALSRRRLEPHRGRFRWSFETRSPLDLDRVLWTAACSVADLLTSPDVDRVRECEGTGCAWLFIDTSKNRTRRWCDMSVCGNRAKARRFAQRLRTHGSRPKGQSASPRP
jgi:predicted RNA-binding Zn ribbon-like protein